ncbi:hypothetical protein [Fulvivirga sp.]|uniref:hypothetical protein n=1 Tax=Fulvivirga sp. TaxID=1931237 RepID=UPI0032EE732C
MTREMKYKVIRSVSVTLIIIGFFQLFVDHGVWYYKVLQIIMVAGLVLSMIATRMKRKPDKAHE